MSHDDRRLTLLHGDGLGTSQTAGQLRGLAVPQAPPPQQLSLWTMELRARSIISAGADGMKPDALARLLGSGIRQIIDFRLAPSFLDAGTTTEEFKRIATDRGIKYEHQPEIANRFAGESWNARVAIDRYKEYLISRPELLEAIHARIPGGPTVLLGSASAHKGTDREVFVDWVISGLADVELVVLDEKDSSCAAP